MSSCGTFPECATAQVLGQWKPETPRHELVQKTHLKPKTVASGYEFRLPKWRETPTVNRTRTMLSQSCQMPWSSVAFMFRKAVRGPPSVIFHHQAVTCNFGEHTGRS